MQTEEEYQDWIRKFYEGNFLIKGWDGTQKELLDALPEHKRPEFETLLSELGELIGKEWARDNSVRKIDSSDLQRWGGRLKAVKNDDGRLLSEILAVKEEALERLKE